MIDVWGVMSNSLWVIGLAVLLAIWSWARYAAHEANVSARHPQPTQIRRSSGRRAAPVRRRNGSDRRPTVGAGCVGVLGMGAGPRCRNCAVKEGHPGCVSP